MADRVAITGLGVLSSNGIGKEAFQEAVYLGKSGVRRMDHLDVTAYHTKIGGFLDDDVVESLHNDKRSMSRFDRFTILSLITAEMAYADSGLEEIEDRPLRKGVIIGTGCGSVHSIENSYRRFYKDKIPYVKPSTIPRIMFNTAASEIAIKYDLRKINNTVLAACTSSMLALAMACQYIRAGMADVMFVGGTESPIVQDFFRTWDSLRVLTRDFNDEPERASRPFTKNRSGMVLSEGSGTVILEREDLAAERKANVYGYIAGIGQTNDAHHIVVPKMETQAECMAEAVEDAAIKKDQVAHIQAHGTSTPLNDVTETAAIKEVFGKKAKSIPVSSVKSMIGHSLGASGSMSLIAVLLGMQNDFIIPTINYDAPDPECDLDYVPNEARSQEVPSALINSFGFGGTNVSLLVQKP